MLSRQIQAAATRGVHPTPDGRHLSPLQGTQDELRAMKRALARAELGPVAVLALTNAILALQKNTARG